MQLEELCRFEDIEDSGWKLGIIEWKDPCLVVNGSAEDGHDRLYNFYTIGYYKLDEETEIYTIVFKLDRNEFPDGQNVFINIEKGSVKGITPLRRDVK